MAAAQDLNDGRIWSIGGWLARYLEPPHHIVGGAITTDYLPRDRDWLDGAFILYCTALLHDIRLEESYSLYFEETDFHTQFKRSGHRVVWAPEARVSQRPSGISARLIGQNLYLFHARLFTKNRGRIAVTCELLRLTAKALLQRNFGLTEVLNISKGWKEAAEQLRNSPVLDSEGRMTLNRSARVAANE